MDKDDLKDLLEELGEGLKVFDACMMLAEQAVGDLKPRATKTLVLLLTTLADIRDDLEPQLARSSNTHAKALYRDYANYTKAGFSKQQAFQLVIASIKPLNFMELLKSAANGAGKGSTTEEKK